MDLNEIVGKIHRERLEIIDLFCKTFIVSQEPKSPEELRMLFEMCELVITQNSDFSTSYQMKLKK